MSNISTDIFVLSASEVQANETQTKQAAFAWRKAALGNKTLCYKEQVEAEAYDVKTMKANERTEKYDKLNEKAKNRIMKANDRTDKAKKRIKEIEAQIKEIKALI